MRVVQMLSVVAVLVLFVCCSDSARGQVASWTPRNPRTGDIITLTYNATAPNAAIRRPAGLTLQTLILREVGTVPVLIETPMTRSGKTWKASFSLPQKDARFLLHQFVSGNLKDDNVGKGWRAMVLGSDGKPLKASHYWRGAVLASGGNSGFGFQKDVKAAKAAIILERKLFPENYSAANLAWYLEVNPVSSNAAKARVRKELREALRLFRTNEEALPMLLIWLDEVGEEKKADSLRELLIAENPRGKVAASGVSKEISLEHVPAKKIALLERYIAEFSVREEELLAAKRQLLMLYVQARQYDMAYAVLMTAPKLDADLFRTIASPNIEKGTGLETAAAWVTDGITRVRKQDEHAKPLSVAVEEWRKSNVNTLASLLNARGLALSKMGKKEEAEADFVEAFASSKGDVPLINYNVIDAYVTNGKYQKAVDTGLECIQKGKANLKAVERLKVAFAKVHGSLTGYDKTVKDARSAAEAMLLRNGINKPAPDFALKDAHGATVNLNDFRGKVAVLAFWSTWSGPSRALLPQLQKVFEGFQYYRNVSFLAVNTSENETNATRDSLVKKLMAGLKCSIPVVYDEGPILAEKYEMEGIPTMYVIDRNGKIQFKHVGFNNGNELVNELTEQIGVLLKH
jgi:peroxiredoxin